MFEITKYYVLYKTKKIQIRDLKCLIYVFFGCFILKFGKTIAIFEINTLGFVKIQIFVQIKKFQIWDQKCLILVCFEL